MLTLPRQRGFTLTELMVTIAVLAVLLGIAVPSFSQFIRNYQIRAQAESILNGIQLARATAVQRNENIQFQLANSDGSFTLGWSVIVENGGAVVQSRSSGESSSSLVLTTVPADSTIVTFNGTGRVVSNNPASNSINTIDVDMSPAVMSAAQSKDLRIRILSGGLIKMCDPNTTVSTDVAYCPQP